MAAKKKRTTKREDDAQEPASVEAGQESSASEDEGSVLDLLDPPKKKRVRKKAAKKKATDKKKSTKKTGGGPSEPDVDAESAMVLDAIGEDADPLCNSFDADASMSASDGSDDETVIIDDVKPSTSGTQKTSAAKQMSKIPTEDPPKEGNYHIKCVSVYA